LAKAKKHLRSKGVGKSKKKTPANVVGEATGGGPRRSPKIWS